MQRRTYSVPEWWISLQKLDICDLLTPLVTPANRLKMPEMAVLEGLDFKHFQGSMLPDPPSLRIPVVISPPLKNACSVIPVQTKKSKLFKPTRSMRRRTYSTWKIKFPSKAQYFWSAHSACYTRLWSKNAGNYCFGRSRFQNFPGEHAPRLAPFLLIS